MISVKCLYTNDKNNGIIETSGNSKLQNRITQDCIQEKLTGKNVQDTFLTFILRINIMSRNLHRHSLMFYM